MNARIKTLTFLNIILLMSCDWTNEYVEKESNKTLGEVKNELVRIDYSISDFKDKELSVLCMIGCIKDTFVLDDYSVKTIDETNNKELNSNNISTFDGGYKIYPLENYNTYSDVPKERKKIDPTIETYFGIRNDYSVSTMKNTKDLKIEILMKVTTKSAKHIIMDTLYFKKERKSGLARIGGS